MCAVVLLACGAPASRSASGRLQVDGARLIDGEGLEVRLRGLNVCSLEFDAQGSTWQLTDAGSAG